MTMIEAAKICFQKFFVFTGRASIREFWKFVLFTFIGSLVCVVIDGALFGPSIENEVKLSLDTSGARTQTVVQVAQYNGGWIGSIFGLICLVPFVAAGWRRMHDVGRPGWLMVLIPAVGLAVGYAIIFWNSHLVPVDLSGIQGAPETPLEISVPSSPTLFLIGWSTAFLSFIVSIVLLSLNPTPGPNKYGPEPLSLAESKPTQ